MSDFLKKFFIQGETKSSDIYTHTHICANVKMLMAQIAYILCSSVALIARSDAQIRSTVYQNTRLSAVQPNMPEVKNVSEFARLTQL